MSEGESPKFGIDINRELKNGLCMFGAVMTTIGILTYVPDKLPAPFAIALGVIILALAYRL
ncbi:hypothetical protein [Methanolapillus millepedarum]|uniref:Uncharacterized protein n=1 Tax=Methanolapillus millepedarum TaxID=3028296 RepID=A0AA96ZV84_9EURY|nr:hypothetical protein MsAc7_06880 [Methanosarcinaceae archaeon Ac7]